MKYLMSIIALVVLVGFAFTALPAAEEVSGKDIFLTNKCNACHAIKSLEIAGKPNFPDLSTVGANEKLTQEFLVKFLNKEEKLDDKNHPIKFKGSADDLNKLVTWLKTLK